MKIFGVALIAALSTIACSKGSEAEEPGQLIAKKSTGELLKPENALVNFVYSRLEAFTGGGALLTAKSIIAPYIIFRSFRQSRTISGLRDFVLENCHVAIGLNPFKGHQANHDHSILDLKHNVGANCVEEEAIVLVTINPTAMGCTFPPPARMQHIPIASRSYTLGLHLISESVAAWNAKRYMRNIPISRVLVDDRGIITTQIDMAYGEEHSANLKNYLGGFVTRGGILAGLIFKQQRTEDTPPRIALYFLPVDGTNELFENLEDEDIRIINVDSVASSGREPGKDQEPSDTPEQHNSYLCT